ncbi:MAG: precorrin-3B C(17)-methyltransferase [Candidatus Bathyarchaeia archaeon]
MGGKIYLVGIGPGSLDHMTPKAVDTLRRAQVIVGHKTHLDPINELVSGKKVISEKMSPIERAEVAVKEALKGKIVAIVSVGDPGIYAIASIFFDLLKERDLRVAVEVVPGITAANSAAALLGSPLGHGFAAISIGDLATPWEIIERQLELAAKADFVVVLYNPRSKDGDWRLKRAAQILMKNKKVTTPVGIVTNAMMEGERVQITTLGEMLDCKIDTQSTVIIGNSETFVFNGRLVTPRKYEIGLGY